MRPYGIGPIEIESDKLRFWDVISNSNEPFNFIDRSPAHNPYHL